LVVVLLVVVVLVVLLLMLMLAVWGPHRRCHAAADVATAPPPSCPCRSERWRAVLLPMGCVRRVQK
jgi:hypothetical protein